MAVAEPGTALDPGPASPHRQRDRRDLVLGLLAILAIQVAVIVAGDSRFTSSTDAGGRAGSIAAAVDNGGCDHDLGYWAAEADPSGTFHPAVNTVEKGGRFLQPSSVLFVCAGSFLSKLLGPPWALAVPVGGVLLAAVGAWMLERRAGGSGLLSLALVGGFGSVAFFGSDTWEHAPAVGCAVLGTALLLTRRDLVTGLAGGVLWGLAISLRVETGIVALMLGGAILCIAELRRMQLRRPLRPAVFGAAAALMLTVDRVVERAVVGADVRGTRTVDTASGALSFTQELEQRARDAAVTTIGVVENDRGGAFLLGFAFVLAVVVLTASFLGAVRGGVVTTAAVSIIGLVVLNRVTPLGYVPGALAAAPVAATGVVATLRAGAAPTTRAIGLASLLAFPLVWATQWTAAHTAQWGGRYQLTSAALLTVAGASLLARHPARLPARILVGTAVLVGLVGLVWHVERTQQIASSWDDLESLECDGVLVSASMFFLREGGGTEMMQDQRVDGCRLLSATPATVGDALTVAGDMGLGSGLVVYRLQQSRDQVEVGDWRVEDLSYGRLGPYDVTYVRVAAPGG